MPIPGLEQLVANPAILIIVTIWTLFWKAVGLWHASRNNQLYWFVALLVLNTVGIAEIIYIKFFQVKRADKRGWPAPLNKFFKN